jgi:hypothetical protein
VNAPGADLLGFRDLFQALEFAVLRTDWSVVGVLVPAIGFDMETVTVVRLIRKQAAIVVSDPSFSGPGPRVGSDADAEDARYCDYEGKAGVHFTEGMPKCRHAEKPKRMKRGCGHHL